MGSSLWPALVRRVTTTARRSTRRFTASGLASTPRTESWCRTTLPQRLTPQARADSQEVAADDLPSPPHGEDHAQVHRHVQQMGPRPLPDPGGEAQLHGTPQEGAPLARGYRLNIKFSP